MLVAIDACATMIFEARPKPPCDKRADSPHSHSIVPGNFDVKS